MIKMDGLYIYEEVQLQNMWDLGNFAYKDARQEWKMPQKFLTSLAEQLEKQSLR